MTQTASINDTEELIIWDSQIEMPDPEWMEEPDILTQVLIERAEQGGYHYLHESGLAWHRGKLYVGWANHRLWERNIEDELIRGRVSEDGMTFGPAETWVDPDPSRGCSYNHPVIATHGGRLWGFFTRWDVNVERPRTEIFQLNDTTQKWESTGAFIPTFIPFGQPRRTRQGHWIMSGEMHWWEAAVAICEGDDWTKWTMVEIPRPADLKFMFPEPTLIERGDQLIALCRPQDHGIALASTSSDGGRTWSVISKAKLQITSAKSFAGTLSTGQQYLISNHIADTTRSLMTIALTEPGGDTFKKMLKLRHQQFPRRRVFGGYNLPEMNLKSVDEIKSNVGFTTEWSYPTALEHEGKLYISYTRGKEDCCMSIVPIHTLKV